MSGQENPCVVIPMAGMERNSGRPRGLTLLRPGEVVVNRLVGQFRRRWPGCEVRLCVGYRRDAVVEQLRHSVTIVDCPEFAETNCCESVRLALDGVRSPVLLCAGDLVLAAGVVDALDVGANCLWGEASLGRERSVGLTVADGHVQHLSHGLPLHWAQLAYLDSSAVQTLAAVLSGKVCRNWFLYEAINALLSAVPFRFSLLGGWLIELNSGRDVLLARHAVNQEAVNQEAVGLEAT